jgi:hypothetical protein
MGPAGVRVFQESGHRSYPHSKDLSPSQRGDLSEKLIVTQSRVEAGCNASTEALRVVGDDEKGTPVFGGITGLFCHWGT